MSSIKLSPNASGTGEFTIAAPNSNTNRTLTLPDATGTVQVSGNPISGTTGSFSGNVTLGSSVLATPSGSAPSYLCRAWVNFDGTGTVAIRASGNVTSITDNGVGKYTVNFTTAMPDTNYAAVTGFQTPAWTSVTHAFTYATTSVNVECANGTVPTYVDPGIFTVAVFR